MLSVVFAPEFELDIFSIAEGHKTRKFDLKDTSDLDDLVEVVKEKLDAGWTLYGGKKQGDLKKLLEGRNKSKNEIKEIFKEREKIMLDSPPESDDESYFYERAMVAPVVAGGS